jgi:SAM-dependent methyltransferase
MTLQEFEEAVFSQRPVPPKAYDHHYFLAQWRYDNNSYHLETRRVIEGKHPQLIKQVFSPSSVLDFGCGNGALLHLLHEIGVHGDGIDFSWEARRAATAAVKPRISLGAIDGQYSVLNQYELVICREVFEHLTVLQIQRAVINLCAFSCRYLYLTTRYARATDSAFSIRTEFDVDPTHITLLSKDYLRSLFVLQGFRSRLDLEERLDWKTLGRVLVFERHV